MGSDRISHRRVAGTIAQEPVPLQAFMSWKAAAGALCKQALRYGLFQLYASQLVNPKSDFRV